MIFLSYNSNMKNRAAPKQYFFDLGWSWEARHPNPLALRRSSEKTRSDLAKINRRKKIALWVL